MSHITHERIADPYAWTPPEGALHLKGFVHEGRYGTSVTYESHQFWLETGTLPTLWVRNGAGVERLTGLRLMARGVRAMAEAGLDREAFWTCWNAFDLWRCGANAGADDETRRHRTAFVEGRLRKRKKPGRDLYKVWIEPKPEAA